MKELIIKTNSKKIIEEIQVIEEKQDCSLVIHAIRTYSNKIGDTINTCI